MSRLVLLLTWLTVAHAGGPENVLVVVNGNSADSRSIGSYYASRRSIPERNVCTIAAPDRETVSRGEYDRLVAKPVAACLRSRDLVDSILYIATTKGVPLRVSGSLSIKGENASVDSELTLLYGELRGAPKHELAGPLPNPFFKLRESAFRHPQFPIYLVTRLAAYDVAGVKAMIDRSLKARNTGRFVIDLRSGRENDGEQWLRDAAIFLPEHRVSIDQTAAVTYGQNDVIGYASWGSNDPNRKHRKLGFRWLPGAIATEFVSTNGRTFERPPEDWTFGSWKDRRTHFHHSPQSLTADLIADGATGASGHVDEPFLNYTPRPDYLLPAYHAGRNLAESFYLSMPVLSWQNIVVGDPLCAIGPPR